MHIMLFITLSSVKMKWINLPVQRDFMDNLDTACDENSLLVPKDTLSTIFTLLYELKNSSLMNWHTDEFFL